VKEYGKLPPIRCVISQLNQVFMNLFVNASHAIKEMGVITISTGAEADWIWIKIRDTGSGIAPENLKRIFEPFFTTKPVGSGTGLGLSLTYGIIKKHQGTIDVESELGKGTCFTLRLPIHPDEAKASAI
jgi:signal transduction histidine kinase